MATPVKVRRLSDEEGRQLQRIVRRGGGKADKSIVKWRRALVVLSSAGGNDVAVIARLVQTSPDRVREMIHFFNDKGMRVLDPQWAGGRPRRTTTEQRNHIITTAKKRPTSLGMRASSSSGTPECGSINLSPGPVDHPCNNTSGTSTTSTTCPP